MNRKTMRSMGVDGCRAGWFSISIDAEADPKFGVFEDIHLLWAAWPQAEAILIDIPIGLISGSGSLRACDVAARNVLKPRRHSSVFAPPCREALSARSYQEACRINHRVCGRKVSIQTWAIASKIKEVDDFLQSTPAARAVFREAHPEIGFWALADYTPMGYSKKRPPGVAERLHLLQKAYPKSNAIYHAALDCYPRKDLARDDILDALVNAVTASRLDDLATLPKDPPKDNRRLPMEIVYARFQR